MERHGGLGSELNYHLSVRLIGLHHAMCLMNVFEAEDSGRFCIEPALLDLLRYLLERNI
jgi:hypothetical protein